MEYFKIKMLAWWPWSLCYCEMVISLSGRTCPGWQCQQILLTYPYKQGAGAAGVRHSPRVYFHALMSKNWWCIKFLQWLIQLTALLFSAIFYVGQTSFQWPAICGAFWIISGSVVWHVWVFSIKYVLSLCCISITSTKQFVKKDITGPAAMSKNDWLRLGWRCTRIWICYSGKHK